MKKYSAVMTGVAFLPMTAAIMVSAVLLGSRLVPRVAPRFLMVPGMPVAAGGLGLMTAVQAGHRPRRRGPAGGGPGRARPGPGDGAGDELREFGVRPEDAGVASATVNTSQQVLAQSSGDAPAGVHM